MMSGRLHSFVDDEADRSREDQPWNVIRRADPNRPIRVQIEEHYPEYPPRNQHSDGGFLYADKTHDGNPDHQTTNCCNSRCESPTLSYLLDLIKRKGKKGIQETNNYWNLRKKLGSKTGGCKFSESFEREGANRRKFACFIADVEVYPRNWFLVTSGGFLSTQSGKLTLCGSPLVVVARPCLGELPPCFSFLCDVLNILWIREKLELVFLYFFIPNPTAMLLMEILTALLQRLDGEFEKPQK
ncbi:hypothetical protein HUJ05_011681 [Dendroctonus ponderosae]|nr:hypothetical protein HUJ05_011681 [Dendroctonus ponderosae]